MGFLPNDRTAPSYLIVGAGVFGASTALQLKRSNPYANITLVDRTAFPNPSSASFDLNKIVRADYHDIFYMKLALEAQELWRKDHLFKPYYNETGMLFAENVGKGIACMAHYRLLGKDTGAKLMSVEEACTQFPEFKNANWTGVNHAYFNPLSGWCDGQVLGAVIQAAIDLGVVYVETTVEKLLFNPSGRCIGVCIQNGRELRASRVVLCAGAMTAKLLADTAPEDFSLHVGKRLVAAAAVSCTVRVAPEKWPKYRNSPVFANVMSHTSGEAVPLNAHGLLKFNHELSFTNLEYHAASGQMFSCPPGALNRSTWTRDIPETFKRETLKVVRNTYGRDLDGLTFESWRICWDAVTPNQDWIIGPHPCCPNLYIATGGSFHAFKFLPILGKYVTAMMDGTLDDERAGRWAWNRGTEGGACVTYIPKRDLGDILAAETMKPRV